MAPVPCAALKVQQALHQHRRSWLSVVAHADASAGAAAAADDAGEQQQQPARRKLKELVAECNSSTDSDDSSSSNDAALLGDASGGRGGHDDHHGGVDIVGLGSGNINVFIQQKLLRTPNDYYTLKDKYQSLIRLPGMGPTKVKKILDAIDKTRKSSFKKLLMALCINSLGGSAAEKLASQLPTWQEFTNASIGQLQSIAGAAAGRDIYEALQTDYYRGLIGKLTEIFREYNW